MIHKLKKREKKRKLIQKRNNYLALGISEKFFVVRAKLLLVPSREVENCFIAL